MESEDSQVHKKCQAKLANMFMIKIMNLLRVVMTDRHVSLSC